MIPHLAEDSGRDPRRRSSWHAGQRRSDVDQPAGINIDGYTEMNGVVHVLTTDLPAYAPDAVRRLPEFRVVQAQHVERSSP